MGKEAFRITAHIKPIQGKTYGTHVTVLVPAFVMEDAIGIFLSVYPGAGIQNAQHVGKMIEGY